MSGECNDCGEHVVDCTCIPTWPSPWISVKNRLPELSVDVLMTDGKNQQVGSRFPYGKGELFLPDYRECFDKATHWMPLPSPPQHNLGIMADDILQIECAPLPFGLDDKIFWVHLSDEEEHDCHECDCYQESYNDWLKKLQDTSGVSQELLGPVEPKHN